MENSAQKNVIERLQLARVKRHIFLCADQTNPKCCSRDESIEIWDHLKKRLDALGLTGQGGILRTKANCLRVCANGPIAVIYPDGVWYHSIDIPALDRIIDEHLIAGQPVRENMLYPPRSEPTKSQ